MYLTVGVQSYVHLHLGHVSRWHFFLWEHAWGSWNRPCVDEYYRHTWLSVSGVMSTCILATSVGGVSTFCDSVPGGSWNRPCVDEYYRRTWLSVSGVMSTCILATSVGGVSTSCDSVPGGSWNRPCVEDELCVCWILLFSSRASVETRHVCETWMPQAVTKSKSQSHTFLSPNLKGHMVSAKYEQPLDELTVQVWLLYDHPNFKYCTLYVCGTKLRTNG